MEDKAYVWEQNGIKKDFLGADGVDAFPPHTGQTTIKSLRKINETCYNCTVKNMSEFLKGIHFN